MYSHDYQNDNTYGPAYPVVELSIKPIGSATEGVNLLALVDSGADATIVPMHILQNAQVELVGRAQMRWGTHHSQPYDVYLGTITIGAYVIRGVRILADPQNNEAILGRDVLNQMIVTLNGLANIVEITQ